MWEQKKAAVDACEEAGLGIVLVPVIARGINEDQVGAILKYAVDRMPAVRGVHFQPMSYFGRYPEDPGSYRVTIPKLLALIEEQTGGMMKAEHFTGGNATNPYCTFQANYLRREDGSLSPLAHGESRRGGASEQARKYVEQQWSGAKTGSCCCRENEPETQNCCCGESTEQMRLDTSSLDEFLVKRHNNTFAVSGMLFQDAYNLDLARLRRCYILETDSRYGMVPFCAYNLTDRRGEISVPMKRTNLDGWIRRQEGTQSLGAGTDRGDPASKAEYSFKEGKGAGRLLWFSAGPAGYAGGSAQTAVHHGKRPDPEGHRMVLTSQSGIERVRSQETSGTAGKAKRVYYSAKDNERTVSFFAAGLSELVFPGEKVMVCMPFSGNRGLGELIAEAVGWLKGIPLAAGTGRSYGELLDMLDFERPRVFVGMPVPLLSLLRLRPENSLERALVSADICPDTVKKEIEARLGTRLYPHYGSREIGLGGAVTCPAFEGMHLRKMT